MKLPPCLAGLGALGLLSLSSLAGAYRTIEVTAKAGGPDAATFIKVPVTLQLINKDWMVTHLAVSNLDGKHPVFLSGTSLGANQYDVATGHTGHEIAAGKSERMELTIYQSEAHPIIELPFTLRYWDDDMDPKDPMAVRPPERDSGEVKGMIGSPYAGKWAGTVRFTAAGKVDVNVRGTGDAEMLFYSADGGTTPFKGKLADSGALELKWGTISAGGIIEAKLAMDPTRQRLRGEGSYTQSDGRVTPCKVDLGLVKVGTENSSVGIGRPEVVAKKKKK